MTAVIVGPVADYTAPADTYLVPDKEMRAVLTTLAGCPTITLSLYAATVDPSGQILADITGTLRYDQAAPEISRDCSAEVAGKCSLVLSEPLQWGSAQVALQLGLASPSYRAGQVQLFPVGTYILTSPGNPDLDAPGRHQVTGYDRCYLLQSAPTDSFSFGYGSTYRDAVRAVFRAAGIIDPTAGLLTEVCSFPGDWKNKTLTQAMVYPVGSTRSHLAIINDLLSTSGCLPLYADRYGRYQINLIPKPATQPLRWTFDGNGDGTSVVRWARQAYEGDVYNVPNQWIFIQSGLTFQPTGVDATDGRYVVVNTLTTPAAGSYGRQISQPPTDQTTTGRTITEVVMLQATDGDDLKKQADRHVDDAIAATEQITLSVAPWPLAWHLDTFTYRHNALPVQASRRVQTRSWRLTVNTDPMQIVAHTVADA